LPGVDPKSLLGAIGNALYRECLIWKYDTSVADDGAGKTHCSLHVTIADSGSTELVIETVEDVEASALLFGSTTAPTALLEVCCQTQMDLTGADEPREVDGVTIFPAATAIDMFLDAFERHLGRLGGGGSGSWRQGQWRQ
jgi:hypothetical protein